VRFFEREKMSKQSDCARSIMSSALELDHVLGKVLVAGAILGLTLLVGACAGRPSQGVLIPTAVAADGTSRVPILAATTRQRSTTDPGEMFSGARAVEVSYAAVTISIPPDGSRQAGDVQWPQSLPGDPSRFVSQKDEALKFSEFIWDGVPRVGQVDPNQEPYNTEFEKQKIAVFDLTSLKKPNGGNVHDIAFEDLNTVMAMVKERFGDFQ
jgi:esterase/lipase superfamily enzyme